GGRTPGLADPGAPRGGRRRASLRSGRCGAEPATGNVAGRAAGGIGVHGLVFAYGVTVLCWGAVAYKLPAFRRRPHDAGVRAYWLTLLLIALGLTVLQWPAYPALDAAV